MLNLATTTTVLRLTTGSAGDIEVTHSYVDAPIPASNASSFSAGGSTIASIATATTTTIVSAPAAATARNIKQVNVFNNHATVSNAIVIDQFDGTNTAIKHKSTLLPGERLEFDETGRWTVYGADGLEKPQSLANVQQLPAVASSATVLNADTDTLKIFARKRAGRLRPSFIDQANRETLLQEKLSAGSWSFYLPGASTTVGLNLGTTWVSGGTVSHPQPATTAPALLNQSRRTRFANVVTTTNQFLGLRVGSGEKRYWRGNSAGLGGFDFHCRFSIGLWPAATVRLFVGVNDSTVGYAISDTLTGNGIGLWHDTTEAATVLNLVSVSAGVAVKTPITLLSALAANQLFDFYMYAAPNGGVIAYALIDVINNTLLVDSTISSNLPSNGAFMAAEMAMSNGTANITVTTVAMEVLTQSLNSDY